MDTVIKWMCIVAAVLLAVIIMISICMALDSANHPADFQYKSHTYIYFPNKGVVHSPDCKHCQLVFD